MTRASTCIGLLVILFLAGCSDWLDWRQCVTVVVRAPDDLHEMSAVQSVRLETTSSFHDRLVGGVVGSNGYKYHIDGEAPQTVLPSGQILVALMMSNGSPDSAPGRIALRFLGDRSVKGPENNEVARAAFARLPVGTPVKVPRAQWPYILGINADGDISGIRPVNGSAGQSLDQIVGPGHVIDAVSIAKSRDEPDVGNLSQAVACLLDSTPNRDFRAIPRKIRTTLFAMGTQSFTRQDRR